MIRSFFFIILSILILLSAACSIIPFPEPPPPQLSATAVLPKVTVMSELPPTWTPEPTLAPTLTFTPSSTPTPTQDPNAFYIGPIMTPLVISYPTNTLDISGWTQVDGKTASISIPPTYEVLDFAGVFMEMIFGVMEAFAEGFVEFAEDIGEEMGVTPEATQEIPDLGEMPDFDFILAAEESSNSAIILASVDRTPETTTEDLLNQALSDSDSEFLLGKREIFNDAPYPMERVILDVEDEELGMGKQIIYVIIGDQHAWNLVFTTPADLFEQNLPKFEAVVNSLTPFP